MWTPPSARMANRNALRAAFSGAGPSAAALRQDWATRSLGTVWPGTDSDWQCAAVDAVCEGLRGSATTDIDVHGACRTLGEQRADVGTYLTEARMDLEVVLGLVAVRRELRAELLDALTIGWADRSVDRLSVVRLVDRANHMATLSYLVMRLDELYREADLVGFDVPDRYMLVVVETERSAYRLIAEARLSALHSALQYAFVGGESVVAVGPHRAVALAAREEPRFSDSLARLRSELKIALSEQRLPSVQTWRQPLPRDAAKLSPTLLGVVY